MGMLDGRVALVTGGSKGLGAATARLFAQAGARVVVTFGSDAQAADRLIASLPGTGHRASHTPAQDTRAIESLAAAIGTTEGRLDILVNNAGSTRVIRHADLRALDDAFFDFVLAVNLRGPFAMVRASQPLLEASGQGLVVNVGSVAGVRGGGSNIAYAAAKAGVHADDDVTGAGFGAGNPGRRRRPEPDGDADDPDVDPAAARPKDREQPAQADRPARGGSGGDPRAGDDDDLCQRRDHPRRRRQPAVKARPAAPGRGRRIGN
jgi:NAD(P)-dependent dehydrogenase (short-subunit alcohol dehydrogenase family)